MKRFSTVFNICECQRCGCEMEVRGACPDVCSSCEEEMMRGNDGDPVEEETMITKIEIDCIDFKEKCPHCKEDNSEIEPSESFDHSAGGEFVEWKDLYTCPFCNNEYIVFQHN